MAHDYSDRFWAKVARSDGCWDWSGAAVHGYGVLQVDGAPRRAHRISWEMVNGPIPDGLFVCHHCDNKRCVRPDHLFLGTHQDNMDDAKRKGRFRWGGFVPPRRFGDAHPLRLHPECIARGERQGGALLTENAVRAIRAFRRAGESGASIAALYGVHAGTVGSILRGKNWRHVA